MQAHSSTSSTQAYSSNSSGGNAHSKRCKALQAVIPSKMAETDVKQHHAVHFGGAADKQAQQQQQPYVYLSNLPTDAYEGTIKQAFEQEGIQVVSPYAC